MATETAPVALTGGAGFEFGDCVAARFMIDILLARCSLGPEFGAVANVLTSSWSTRPIRLGKEPYFREGLAPRNSQSPWWKIWKDSAPTADLAGARKAGRFLNRCFELPRTFPLALGSFVCSLLSAAIGATN